MTTVRHSPRCLMSLHHSRAASQRRECHVNGTLMKYILCDSYGEKNESIWRKSGLEVHRMIYINHRNEVNQAIRKAKCDYYITLLEKTDVKVAFSRVNRLLASPSPQLPDQLGDGESLCEKFACYFY